MKELEEKEAKLLEANKKRRTKHSHKLEKKVVGHKKLISRLMAKHFL